MPISGIRGVLAVRIVAAALAALMVAPLSAVAQSGLAPVQQGPESVADLAEGLLSAVVNISTTQFADDGEGGNVVPPSPPEGSPFGEFFDEFFRDRQGPQGPRRGDSLGSGFIIDASEGIIVTNNHVIADADEIEVTYSDGSTQVAELVGTDPETDIALLKVDPTVKELNEVPFGDSDAIRIGDWVMAIGNPFGFGGSVSVGIVSARNRNIEAGRYDDFIQTDAAINRGNSGGPLFNMFGEVIGINTAIISPSGGSIGIGFSIPSRLATRVIDQLREFGETRRGWLGVRIQAVTEDIAESLGMDGPAGALVAGIMQGGPVDGGEIEAGDVIVEFDGQPITEMRDLPRIVADTAVGKEVEVVVVRNGERLTVGVTLGRLEDSERLAAADQPEGDETGDDSSAGNVTFLGLTVTELNDETRARFEIDAGVSGALISEVDPESMAATKGIEPGDVITEIAQESVNSPQQAAERVDSLKTRGRKNALLMLMKRNGELKFETIRMD